MIYTLLDKPDNFHVLHALLDKWEIKKAILNRSQNKELVENWELVHYEHQQGQIKNYLLGIRDRDLMTITVKSKNDTPQKESEILAEFAHLEKKLSFVHTNLKFVWEGNLIK